VVFVVVLPATALADERYPRAVIARPLTLPQAVVVVGGDVGANNNLSAIGGTPIAGVGITDDLEVQIPYAFAARELEPRGSLSVDVGYKLVRGAIDGKLEIIARARAGYSLLDDSAMPYSFGVHVQYNALPWLALITGAPGTEQLRFASPSTFDLSLPLAAGVQVSPVVYMQLDTKLAQVALHDSDSMMLGRDTTPVALTAVWNALHALDVQAAVGTDLTTGPGDALWFLVGARYYAGSL
jgi:hypothetical protein